MALFGNCTMKIANQEQNKERVTECPSCKISVRYSLGDTPYICPECGHDIWTTEAGYYGLLELFPGETGRPNPDSALGEGRNGDR